MENHNKARVIAFYLPQFYPTVENDKWWRPGFTEWHNVVQTKPLYKGYYQPHLPADLGFYDLRLPETREAQANLAREAGIEGFCYWHDWLGGGRRLLDRVFREVVKDGETGYLFKTIEECAQSIRKVCTEPQEALILRAQKFAVDNLSQEVYGPKIIEVYNKVLNN